VVPLTARSSCGMWPRDTRCARRFRSAAQRPTRRRPADWRLGPAADHRGDQRLSRNPEQRRNSWDCRGLINRAATREVIVITHISPESAATPKAGIPAADPGGAPQAPQRAARAMRHPLLCAPAAVAGFALGWGAVQAAHNLWASRHDNTPNSSSSHAPSGALSVSGHGVTLTFPTGWVNVPTTPDKLAQFVRANAAKFPHHRSALKFKNQLENIQNLRTMAMLVYRLHAKGIVTGTTNVVVPATTPSAS
jgi:hypothetical protein